MVRPSGEQFEIAFGDQRASCPGRRRAAHLLGRRPRRSSTATARARCARRAAARCSCPWPNRLAGRTTVRRPRSPVARQRACHRLRDPRARSLGRVERWRSESDRVVVNTVCTPAGVPVRARDQDRVRAVGGWTARLDDGDQRRRRSVPVRGRRAPVPSSRLAAWSTRRCCISRRTACSRSMRTECPPAPTRSRGPSSTSCSRDRSARRSSITASPICDRGDDGLARVTVASTEDGGTG